MGNVQMEADQIRFKNASYGNVQTALTAALTGGGGSKTLAGLTDTDITTPSDGQVLMYDGTSEKWENAAIPAQSLDGLSDTTITTPTDGQVLTYDNASSKWVNANPASGGGGLTIAETETKIGTFAGLDLYCIAYALTSIITNGTMELTGIPAGATIRGAWGGIVESNSFKPLPYYTNISTPGPIGFDIAYATDKWLAYWRCPSGHTTITGHLVVAYTKASAQSK